MSLSYTNDPSFEKKKKENPIWEKVKAINNLFNVFKLLFIF